MPTQLYQIADASGLPQTQTGKFRAYYVRNQAAIKDVALEHKNDYGYVPAVYWWPEMRLIYIPLEPGQPGTTA